MERRTILNPPKRGESTFVGLDRSVVRLFVVLLFGHFVSISAVSMNEIDNDALRQFAPPHANSLFSPHSLPLSLLPLSVSPPSTLPAKQPWTANLIICPNGGPRAKTFNTSPHYLPSPRRRSAPVPFLVLYYQVLDMARVSSSASTSAS